jgi:hypothetical protein
LSGFTTANETRLVEVAAVPIALREVAQKLTSLLSSTRNDSEIEHGPQIFCRTRVQRAGCHVRVDFSDYLLDRNASMLRNTGLTVANMAE